MHHCRYSSRQSTKFCSLTIAKVLVCVMVSSILQGVSASRHVKIEQHTESHLASSRDDLGVQSEAAAPSLADPVRIVACVQLKNELPYLLEWVEFHHMMGFTHIVIYDDFSSDNVTMLDALYKQHGRTYLTVVPSFGTGQDKFTHRAKTAEHCFLNFHHMADWMINIDVDEFVWSPIHSNLQQYFHHEVPAANHILQVGATRFGWSGQRERFTYSLAEVTDSTGVSVELRNPNGVQLLVDTHVHRAPDQRFMEPEKILRQANEFCRGYDESLGEWSPCTNDYDGKFGKAFIRTDKAMSVWTHGGNVRLPFSSGNLPYTDIGLSNGGDLDSGACPSPICERSDPFKLHIYHFRSPSMADSTKKNVEMADLGASESAEAMQEQLQKSDAEYAAETWFFNQVRDISLAMYAGPLRERIAPLLSTSFASHSQ